MSDNAILAAMQRMGIDKDEMSGHGIRAVARTILDEVLDVRPDSSNTNSPMPCVIRTGAPSTARRTYPERRKMMQQWADYLDKLKAGAEIIPTHQSA